MRRDLLLGADNLDERLAGNHEHLLPAPLVVHQVGINLRVVGVGRPHAPVVSQRLVRPCGKDLIILHGSHHTTPTLWSWIRPFLLMFLRDQESQTSSISTSSIPSICSSRSLMSSWIMSVAGHPMQVYVSLILAVEPSTSMPRINPKSTRLIGYSGSRTSFKASRTSSSVLIPLPLPVALVFCASSSSRCRAPCSRAGCARRTP